ncbi:cysteine desulfurase CsdA [Plesiomonas shigelloides]|uniref:cysteine desulfurase CsdA n=1 Tax=Plesiomonas shigelloides TaxID=703 RepID=UPI001C5B129B|nr:cysteine desulfurase CsdA [Plesiomonas shigelloides]MBW3792003.1 cysteine desulfurase CsdA [Plesiomonas shigelloides]
MTFAFAPDSFRRQFPALQDNAGVYLDSTATMLKPLPVIEASDAYYRSNGATVHRSQHQAAASATRRFEHARSACAALLNAPDPRQIIWTRGTTEAINMVANGYLRDRLQPGDEILVGAMEHHANLVPWLLLAEQTGATIVRLPMTEELLLDITALPALLNARTKLVAVGMVSNVTGSRQPVEAIIRAAHAVGAVVMLDAAQAVAHEAVDVQALDADFVAFSAHKLYGPTGVGVLYGKMALLESMRPWHGGGKMIQQVSFDGITLAPIPQRFEAGTPNIAGILAFDAALEWLAQQDLAAADQHACALAATAAQQMQAIDGLQLYRPPHASTIIAFNVAGLHHGDLATLLAEQGIALRAGMHCAQPLTEALGVSGTVRVSFAPYNSEADVSAFISALQRAVALLREK